MRNWQLLVSVDVFNERFVFHILIDYHNRMRVA